jgi:hypothetical protein
MVREVPNYAEQYFSEHPEHHPPQPNPQAAPDAPVRGAEQSAEDCHPEEAQAFAKRTPANEGPLHLPAGTDNACTPRATPHSAGGGEVALTAVKPAAERRQNAAHGASRGNKAKTHQVPEERKRICDPQVQSEPSPVGGNNSQPSPKEKAHTDATPPLTTRQTSQNHEIKKLEASIEGAMRGNWRDLRTVFNTVGLTPPKPSRHHR